MPFDSIRVDAGATRALARAPCDRSRRWRADGADVVRGAIKACRLEAREAGRVRLGDGGDAV